ncbi:MAG: ribonuclease P protein component [Labilithrix sp.]|nr:ribonuclease P protein component [Labilithrix sp.]MBX3224888.1 ribonuclease P protein component [Labilithrix sp.]
MASFGFGRERRIRRRADFLRVQSNGERATSRHFVLLVSAREPSRDTATPLRAPSRLGIVATRKVGDATMRNRIKRLCRECFRLWPGFVPDGIDLVVIARDGADALTLAAVRDEWSRARPALLKRCASVLRPKVEGAAAAPGTPSIPRKT